jgi:hypothetical protein
MRLDGGAGATRRTQRARVLGAEGDACASTQRKNPERSAWRVTGTRRDGAQLALCRYGRMARDVQGREHLVWQVDMTREAQLDFFQG